MLQHLYRKRSAMDFYQLAVTCSTLEHGPNRFRSSDGPQPQPQPGTHAAHGGAAGVHRVPQSRDQGAGAGGAGAHVQVAPGGGPSMPILA